MNLIGDFYLGYVCGVVVGDILCNLLVKVGYDVFCEYYINDVGN